MNEDKLDKKQIAAIRMRARRQRISRIRKRTSLFALYLASLFTALVIATSGHLPGLGPDPAVQVAAAPAAKPVPLMSYQDDEDDDDEGDAYHAESTADQAQTAGEFFSSDPATPVQSSQS